MISGRRSVRFIPDAIEETRHESRALDLRSCRLGAVAVRCARRRRRTDRPMPAGFPGRRSRAGSATPPARQAGAPISRLSERSGLQVGSVGLLGDVYFGADRAAPGVPASGFRATSGVLIGARSPLLGASRSRPTDACSALRRQCPSPRSSPPSTAPPFPTSASATATSGARAAGASAPTSASSRRAPPTLCASAASSAARKASTTSSATCAWPGGPARRLLFLLNRSPGISR